MGKEPAMFQRQRFEQTKSLQDRLKKFASDVRARAAELPPGTEKDELLQRARQADTASHVHDWAYSPGLQPPK
jgi:hypothetical protein